MFTGIIETIGTVVDLIPSDAFLRYALSFPHTALKEGASVSVDGVCQTVVLIESDKIWFDAIPETCRCTTLETLYIGKAVNIERSARLGEEIGGHCLSGHISTRATLTGKVASSYTFSIPAPWEKYLFAKGYIALDGISLTLGEIGPARFTVHLIPETLRRTTLETKHVGSACNVEIDMLTQTTVDTVERLLLKRDNFLQ